MRSKHFEKFVMNQKILQIFLFIRYIGHWSKIGHELSQNTNVTVHLADKHVECFVMNNNELRNLKNNIK